ncbi:accessory Sec system translocase SecA2 [Agreia sp. Leaf283]|uniref:accessory Sec system translocase SecA2 n=1 Tax=Agreia sp. Leaf283 TaxID=1736321 RepID=UPI0006F5FF88|nr:accessory Sec system translocase SecA2 [Agreia sp. Leaf283]KQP55432.1 hypothetical protein ASF51_09490 [Agreia sp. Leaf283]
MTQHRARLTTGLARVLGRPGTVSFRRFARVVKAAEALGEPMRPLTDAELRREAESIPLVTGGRLETEPTARFLAVAREATARAVGLIPFPEQLLACCALLSGQAVEMDTGEGKTLVGALAAAGHAMAGRHVHVLSVNDYLAERDATWMGPLYELMGVSVGWVGEHTTHDARRRAYLRDVVYAPVSEVGFDVLRDRFAFRHEERVVPRFDAAVVDEADAVMIDDAMVPLVLAGAAADAASDFGDATAAVEGMVEGRDYLVDTDRLTVGLTDEGLDRLEAELGGINLYSAEHIDTLTRINLALDARVLVRRDIDYLVDGGSIKLINTGRGRVAHLQRWPDGLHAAIEAKEHLSISTTGVVLDTISIQDLLLGYGTLSGMSGTLIDVAEDLIEFYRLPVGRIDRHRPNVRVDAPARVFLTVEEKFAALVDDIVERHETGQPVLVGTLNVAESEYLADLLRRRKIDIRVLNARNDEEEASIIARAGEMDAVTISTQMSGRGTDIRLGGADARDRDEVVGRGGLTVIAAGRYASRRLDSQLRGRSARQGDPGSSSSYASLRDELVQSNSPAHVLAQIDRHGDELPVVRLRRIVDTSQAIAENIRLDRHRATWAYSRALSSQRLAVLKQRSVIFDGDDAATAVRGIIPEHIRSLESAAGTNATGSTARALTLHYLDEHWMRHLAHLQDIRDGIHLQALAGHKPDEEFHRIALREFQGFFDAVYDEAAQFMQTLTPADMTRPLDELGLRRPSATWTYMVTDDPFGSTGDRLARELGKRWRRTVLRTD